MSATSIPILLLRVSGILRNFEFSPPREWHPRGWIFLPNFGNGSEGAYILRLDFCTSIEMTRDGGGLSSTCSSPSFALTGLCERVSGIFFLLAWPLDRFLVCS